MTDNSDEDSLSGDAWYEARVVVSELRDVLLAANLAESFMYLQADINAFGKGIVVLGRTTPAAARRLAQLLRVARESLGDEEFARGLGSGGDGERADGASGV
ncbi:hypothetical protein [Embleya sp. NPDC005575]|uniref:hypothetical protein n=1 Tax=Embleya sp. NPDC005575 TaxID=3156892 RepID=UPI0033AE9DA5